MRVLAGGAARLTPYNDADCLAGLSGNPGEATLRLSFASGGYSFYRDYRLTIAAAFAAAPPSPVFAAPTEERFTVNLDSASWRGSSHDFGGRRFAADFRRHSDGFFCDRRRLFRRRHLAKRFGFDFHARRAIDYDDFARR